MWGSMEVLPMYITNTVNIEATFKMKDYSDEQCEQCQDWCSAYIPWTKTNITVISSWSYDLTNLSLKSTCCKDESSQANNKQKI